MKNETGCHVNYGDQQGVISILSDTAPSLVKLVIASVVTVIKT